MAYFAGFLINTKGLNACRHCWDSTSFCFQRFSDYCKGGNGGQVSSGKTPEHRERRNEAVFTGTDAEGQEKDECLHRPNTLAFLLELQCVTVMVSLRLLITSEMEPISLA